MLAFATMCWPAGAMGWSGSESTRIHPIVPGRWNEIQIQWFSENMRAAR